MCDSLTFRLLRYIKASAETLNFTRAAEQVLLRSLPLPNGKLLPVALSELAQAQGYPFPFRGPAQKLSDASMYRWLHDAIYDNKGMLAIFTPSLIEGGVCLVAMLWFAVPLGTFSGSGR